MMVAAFRRDKPAVVGEFMQPPGGAGVDRIPSTEPCPYCREPMTEHVPANAFGRVVEAHDAIDAAGVYRCTVEMLPAGARLWTCRPCRQAFTAPATYVTEADAAEYLAKGR